MLIPQFPHSSDAIKSYDGPAKAIFEISLCSVTICSPVCIWNRTRNGKVRSTDVIPHTGEVLKGREGSAQRNTKPGNQSTHSLRIPTNKEFKWVTEEKGSAGHGRKARRSKGLATASSTVGELHHTHVSKGKSSISEEPTVYLEKYKVESQCEMLPKSQRGRTVMLGKRIPTPKWGQDNWRL